ncbi:acyl--CoA ligase [Rhodotorula paludigena]|uniref:acyl--CoA ligase n=1 Tax=Rhodotorula paludigena TaxID=86838 RepID=UPI0031731AB9
MPFDRDTGIYTSRLRSVALPDKPLSIYDFLFEPRQPYTDDPTAFERSDPTGRTWLLDAHSSRSLTYEQARERTDELAGAFNQRGLTEGTTLVVFAPNDVDYGPSLWAAFRQGAVASCANPAYQPAELAHQLKTVDAHHPVKIVLVHPDSVETAVKACEEVGFSTEMIVLLRPPGKSVDRDLVNTKSLSSGFPTLDDIIAASRDKPLPPKVSIRAEEAKTKLALLSFSSGTTGPPKAVMIPHYAVIANVLQAAAHWQQTKPLMPYDAKTEQGDVVMACLPFYHIYGLIVILHGSLFQNVPIVVLPRFDFRAFLQSIQDFRISTLFLVPPQIILLVKQDIVKEFDLSSVKMAMAGAAPLTNDTVTAFRKRFPSISIGQGYGMTESATIISLLDPSVVFPGASAGLLVPNIEAKIVSEGENMPPGKIGELWSRGPSNALGYLGNEKATKETFDADGFLHTGDEAYLDEEGLLFITDRLKELIKVSGFQVAPAELEGHLLGHEDVQDVCVIGIPDEKRGEAPKAYISLTPAAASRIKSDGPEAEQALLSSVKDFVAQHKIKYKHLAEVEIIEAIPKTPSGKLLRKDLRVRHAQKNKKGGEKL